MFDFVALQSNTENPTFIAILLTILFSFILSSLIALTYEKTSRDVSKPDHYIQALILIALVAATVMQAIGDSLARGLGMLGALAIIRFRTRLRDPRNIVFMFASLAAGIACGVYGFIIAIVGTIGFCVVAFLLRFSSFSKETNMIGNLRLELLVSTARDDIKPLLDQYCKKHRMVRYRILTKEEKEGWTEYEYIIKMKQESQSPVLVRYLKERADVQSVRLSFRDTQANI